MVYAHIGVPQGVQRWVYLSVHNGGYTSVCTTVGILLSPLCAPRWVYSSLPMCTTECVPLPQCVQRCVYLSLSVYNGRYTLPPCSHGGYTLPPCSHGGYSPLSCAQRWVFSSQLCTTVGYLSLLPWWVFLLLPWWVIPKVLPWWVIPKVLPWWVLFPLSPMVGYSLSFPMVGYSLFLPMVVIPPCFIPRVSYSRFIPRVERGMWHILSSILWEKQGIIGMETRHRKQCCTRRVIPGR